MFSRAPVKVLMLKHVLAHIQVLKSDFQGRTLLRVAGTYGRVARSEVVDIA